MIKTTQIYKKKKAKSSIILANINHLKIMQTVLQHPRIEYVHYFANESLIFEKLGPQSRRCEIGHLCKK